MADEANPIFQIQRVYLKGSSLEQPNSPAILLEQEQPSVDIQLGVEANPAADGIFEVCVTATVQTKIKDKTVFLVEVKQAGVFGVRNLEEADYRRAIATLAPNVLERVQRVCRPHLANGYAQRYHFWMNYAEAHSPAQQPEVSAAA